MIKRLVMIVIVLAAIGGSIFALQQKKAAELAVMSARTFPPASVTIAEVKSEDWRQTLFAVGSIAAEQGINVTAPLPGTVVEIRFQSGQQVKRGDVLIAQDVGVQMAELEGLTANLELRTLQFERAKRLLADKQISQSDYDARRAARNEADAAVRAKQAFIERKKVYVPFDGTLGIRMVDLGTYLEPGDPIVPLQMLDPVHVDYALPEQFLSRLSVGQAVEVEVPAYPDEKFQGRITAFDPGIDPGTRSLRIRATIANPGLRLRPGMFAEVQTAEGYSKPVASLPEMAVTYSTYGQTVFVVVENDGRTSVERRQIQTGSMRDGRVEIVGGVDVGERVVAVGQNKLRNGMPVVIVEDVAPALAGGNP